MAHEIVPPHNMEAEQSLLGCLLIDNDVYELVYNVYPQDMYRRAHQVILGAIRRLLDAHEPADLVTVVTALRADQDLDTVGGSAYLSGLTSSVPSSANAEVYANIVREHSRLRQLSSLGARISGLALNQDADVQDIVRDIDVSVMRIMQEQSRHLTRRFGETMHELGRDIDARAKRRDDGVTTSLKGLDNVIGSLNPQDYVIIGARPSVGKTAISLQAALSNAQKGVGVLFWSCEMPASKLAGRSASIGTSISGSKISTGMLSPSEMGQVTDYASQVYDLPLWINDTPNPDFGVIDRGTRRMVRDHNIGLVIVDYLSLVRPRRTHRGQEMHEAMAQMSHDAKQLARDTNTVMVWLSQLTREADGKRPTLKDLRETGAIEQDADVVILLHPSGKVSGSDTAEKIEAIVAKNRNGRKGVAELLYEGEYTRFRDF